MAIEFRVFLDGTQYVDTDPGEIEKIYKRGEDERGFVTSYAQDITFYKEAYTYLKSVADANPCAEVELLIQARSAFNALWENFIEAKILVQTLQFQENNSIVKASIEDTSVYGLFRQFKSMEIDFTQTESMNGVVSLTDPITEIHNFFLTDGSIIGATVGDFAKAYSVADTLSFLLEYITDGRLTLASDFLTSGGIEHVIRLNFATTPLLGEVVEVHLLDFRGVTTIARVTSNGVTADFPVFLRAAILLGRGAPGVGVHNVTYSTGGSGPGSIEVNIICYENVVEVEEISTSGATVITDTIVTQYTRNANNLYISDGYRLLNNTTNPQFRAFFLSFDKLFNLIATAYDLSYSIEKVDANYQLRIEPISYFFANAVTLTLDGVPDVETDFIQERIHSSIAVGRAGGFFRTWQFKTLNRAGTIEMLIPEDTRFITTEIIQEFAIDYEADIFLFRGKGLGNPDEPEEYQLADINNPAVPSGISFLWFYSMGLDINNRIQDVIFYSPDALNLGASVETHAYNAAGAYTTSSVAKQNYYIGEDQKFIRRSKFDKEISFRQLQNLSPVALVKFNTNGPEVSGGRNKKGEIVDNREGYIDNISTKPGQVAKLSVVV